MRIYAIFAFALWTTTVGFVTAQELYRLPPQSIVDVVDAPPQPSVGFSPDNKWMLLIARPALPSIEEMSRRWLGLAGMRVDPLSNGSFQAGYPTGLAIRPTADATQLAQVPLPAGAKLGSTSWSHKSNWLLFSLITDQGTELWGVSPQQPSQPRRLVTGLNPLWNFVEWLPNGDSFLCCTILKDRGPEPVAKLVPLGPNVQESVGQTSPIRTFQDLLDSDHEEQLFEYFSTSEIIRVDLESGATKTVFGPAMVASMSVSPSGQQLMVSTIQRPFSRQLTAGSFPEKTEVIDLSSGLRTEILNAPMAENIPIEGVPTWRRRISWRPDQPATLTWVEALDGGDPRTEVPHRDKVMMQAAPFDSEPVELCRTEHRFSGLSWTQAPVSMLCSDYDRDRRWIRTVLYDTQDMSQPPQILFDRSLRDRYGDPGSPVTEPDENGFRRIVKIDNNLWLTSAGASPDGDLPFLDQMNIDTQETTRIWRCEKGGYESVRGVVYDEAGKPTAFMTQYETTTLPPNLRQRDMAGSIVKSLTDFPDPTPQIRGIQKQLVTYQRKDGVPLSATMYLPADWKSGQTLPLLLWAYPIEFNDASTAGQVTSSPSRFTQISGSSHLALVLEGYAVMDNATMPVIGEPETMNDTFVEQIVDSAQAAIDYAVEMGVADRHRIAVAGHSYGAFMTANLLAHCRLFRAGIARSGAYNRTLTPFGFQSERRPYWEAREVYEKVSPFTWANQIKDPILLIHGEKDNNSGTFPIQSERLYQAIKGNGGTVRLVTLPEESHGYRARESVLHTHAETLEWLNAYVRDAQPASP